jgi:hypothetical protein
MSNTEQDWDEAVSTVLINCDRRICERACLEGKRLRNEIRLCFSIARNLFTTLICFANADVVLGDCKRTTSLSGPIGAEPGTWNNLPNSNR